MGKINHYSSNDIAVHLSTENRKYRHIGRSIQNDIKNLNEVDIKKISRLWLAIIFGFSEYEILKLEIDEFINLLKSYIDIYGFIDHIEQDKRSTDFVIHNIMSKLIEITKICQTDIDFAFNEDPAVFYREEIIRCYPFAKAVPIYRLANLIEKNGVKLLPRMLSSYIHSVTGIDIHPAAEIDSPFFIDHGTGVVIGGTTIIGKKVKLFHGVTLGAKAFKRDEQGIVVKGKKRHPTIGDNVIIYAGASVLGGETIIGSNSVIGGNVCVTESIPKNTMVLVNEKTLSYIRL
jgi:serine O-acetyltransferase